MNPSQKAAVFSPVLEPLIILAPPGSGKTFCLVNRLQHALAGAGLRPEEVLLLTFTNKAAKEIRDRAVASCPMAEKVVCSTFHSFCLRICRQFSFVPRNATVWGDAETKKGLRGLIVARLLREDPNADTSAEKVRPLVQQACALLNRPLSELPRGSEERALVEAYGRLKEQQCSFDFDDMISIVCERVPKFASSPLSEFKLVMIDEWQDTSVSQLELVKLFAKCTRGISVVGDPHQSIYAFRGAAFSNWKKLADLISPRVVCLSTNYRSTSIISSVCQALIAYNPVPKLGDATPQEVLTVRPEKDPVQIVECATGAEEARFVALEMAKLHKEKGVAFSDMAVLYRSNPRQAVSRVLEPFFLQARVPYTIIAGQALYEAKVVKQVLSYCRLLLNPRDEMAFDVVAKHQKLPKTFATPWRSYRGKEPSSVALQRFSNDRSPVLGAYRESLLKIARLFSSWKLDRIVKLSAFVRSTLLEEAGGFDWRDESTSEKLSFLLGQMEEADVEETTIETQLVSFLEQIALFSPSERQGQDGGERSTLSTIHQSKGLEWRAVFVIQCLDGVVPSKQALQKKSDEEDASSVDGVEEERRLFFVAASRAKQFLFLTHPKPGEGGKRSRFLEEMLVGSRKEKLTSTKSPTEFSSASTLLRASSTGSRMNELILQRVWPEPIVQEDENEESSPKRSKTAPAVLIAPTCKPKDAFSVLMQRK